MIWIHQDAWFHFKFDKESNVLRSKKEGKSVRFILSGKVTINGQELETRDGFGIWNVPQLQIKTNTEAEILLMEVPMQ
jgi:redox-sensitive bicupin YhaK (pirin superfamily)